MKTINFATKNQQDCLFYFAQYYLALRSNEAQLTVSKTSFIAQILIYIAKRYW